jgi:hypothetical protein
MKIKLIILGIFLVSVLVHVSCNKDFLNTEPLDKVASSATWADGPLSEAFIYNIYSYLYYAGFHEEGLSSISDEAMFTHAGRGYNPTTEGTESPSNSGWFNDTFRWGNMWEAIRQCNVALKELPESTFDDDNLRNRLIGEAYFMRAYYYHQLLRHWGGIPIIDAPYGLDDEYSIARNSFAECIDFIVADLDEAASRLNGVDETPGRASRVASLALKSRVLLYAASDLHDAATAQANSSLLAGYGNIDLIAYTGGSQDARWQDARSAAEAALAEATGWKLDLTAPVSPEEGKANYVSLYTGGQSAVGDAGAAVELLFQRTHTAAYTVEDGWPLGGINFGINNGPNGYHNWAGNTPIQQLVDDYEMMDGSTFDWNNPAHAGAPYTDRDPRFYATILYDGADWKPRPSDVASFDPANQVQTGYYDDGAGGVINGIDTRDAPLESWNGSRSHYYVRKFIDPDPALTDDFSSAQTIPWPFLRTTELVLNYAEALYETGDQDGARAQLNRVRFRAGMPAVTDSGTDLWNRIVNERRVELAYEEHRYFDCKRWMIAPTTTGSGIMDINITATLIAGQTPHDPYRYDPTVYSYEYVPASNTETEVRTWNDKMYYRPISRDEMNRNELLVNNPGHTE